VLSLNNWVDTIFDFPNNPFSNQTPLNFCVNQLLTPVGRFTPVYRHLVTVWYHYFSALALNEIVNEIMTSEGYNRCIQQNRRIQEQDFRFFQWNTPWKYGHVLLEYKSTNYWPVVWSYPPCAYPLKVITLKMWLKID